MYLFKPKSVPKDNDAEQVLFYPGDRDATKLTSSAANHQYEDLCNALVKSIIKMMRTPCTNYKALIHDILRTIEQESKKIAIAMGFQENFCHLRKAPSFNTYLDSFKTNNTSDDMKVKVTLLTKYDKQRVKEYMAHGFDQIAQALHNQASNSITQEFGLIQGILPAKDGKSRYIFKLYTQTSIKFTYIPTGRETVLSVEKAKEKSKNIDQSQYVIKPQYKKMDEAINHAIAEETLIVEAGAYKNYLPIDIVVGDIEILYKNTWLLVSRHLTGKFGATKESLIDKDIPCAVIRSEVDVIEPLAEVIASHLEILLKTESKNLDEMHSNVANIMYLLEQSCPYFSANTHATRIIIAACYGFHDLHLRATSELEDLFTHAIYAPWQDRFVKKASAVLKRSCCKSNDSEKLPEQTAQISASSDAQRISNP